MTETQLRDDMTRLSKSLFDRSFSVGSAGNISAATENGFLITPSNSCLGFLDPARISKLDRAFKHVDGDKPSKEVFLHRAFYDTRPGTGAVVHLHSTYATALSCRADLEADDCIPPLTPYVVMRVGRVPLVPYFRPGDERGGKLIHALGGCYSAALLANHGPVVSGKDLTSTVYAAEELEETAKLLVTLHGAKVRMLEPHDVAALRSAFS